MRPRPAPMPWLLMLTILAGASRSPRADVTAAEPPRPNIIFIMSDDMGWSDLGCYGGEIATPTLDSLAGDGVRFTQFYNTARCCPTRASLLTGLYAHQAGIGHMMDDRGLDGYRGDLNRRCVTVAEVLRTAGYRTYMAGKWHVTKTIDPADEAGKHNWPLQRGFDRFYGTIHGAGSFFDPNSLTRDNALISPYADPEYETDEFYYTDAINDHAVRFVREHAVDHGDQPFFMYVAHTAPHWPMHAKIADIDKYRGKYDAGYDAIRAARMQRLAAMGLVDPDWELTPQRGGAWADVEDREFETRCMEVYAAMIDCLDQGIGRLVSELKRTGQFDHTVILFFHDNGGCAEAMGRRQQNPAPRHRGDRPSLPPLDPDHLQTDMIPRQTRDGFPMRQGYGVLPGAADTYHGYGEAWANVSNTPFREYKHWVHEGGISTPLIAHWPQGIPATRQGLTEPQPAHLIDLMATAVDLAGAEYPRRFDGYDIVPMEGVSLTPAFSGEPLGRPGPIFWEHEGNRAVRDGRWKLVAKGPGGPWELYDMRADRTETRDLAAAHPERTAKMVRQWEAWADRAGVLPWIWQTPYVRQTRADPEQPADNPGQTANDPGQPAKGSGQPAKGSGQPAVDAERVPSAGQSSARWRDDAAAYARLMSQVKWTPAAETMPDRRGGFFEKGKQYTGVPYSSVRSVGRYVGFDISLGTFLAAVENPLSVVYTENLAGKVPNAASYYGKVCSSYTSYALQCAIWEVSRLHGPEARDGVTLVDPPVARSVRVGDIVYTPPRPGSHVEIVTAVTTDEQGEVTHVRVEESRPLTTRTTDYPAADFDAHLAARDRQLFRITDLDGWRGDNRAEDFRFPNYRADADPPAINRTLLLDLGDWVPYQQGQPVKFHVMDRDSRGVRSLVIRRGREVVETIGLDGTGLWERVFEDCGDYTAEVVFADGSSSQACEFAICDLELRLPPEPVSLDRPWEIGFESDNIDVIAVYLYNEADSYGRHPLFLSDEQRKRGTYTVPANLLKKAGDVQVWLIGEHRYGRLKTRKDIAVMD